MWKGMSEDDRDGMYGMVIRAMKEGLLLGRKELDFFIHLDGILLGFPEVVCLFVAVYKRIWSTITGMTGKGWRQGRVYV